MKKCLSIAFIGCFSGIIYVLIELFFRQTSDITMFWLAFCVGILLSYINDEFLSWDSYYEYQVLLGTFIATCFEQLFGMLFNQDFHIWDYRGMWGTLPGNQVNILFIGAWMLITALGLPILDYLQWKLGLEQKPYYRSFIWEWIKKFGTA